MSVRWLRRGSIAASGGAAAEPVTYTLYPSADGYVNAALASADGSGQGVGTTGSDDLVVGWASAAYYESFLAFDTSAVVGTITSATLHLYGVYDGSSGVATTVEARAYDWGPTLTVDDWRHHTSLGGLTLLATLSSVGFTTSGYNVFTSAAAFLSNINQAGTTRLILNTDLHRAGLSSGDYRYLSFYFSEQAGTSQDPKLVIEALV